MKQAEAKKHFARLVARAWRDDAFRKRLVSKPHATLKAEGIEVPKGAKVRFHQETERELHVVIPAKPGKVVTAKKRSATASMTTVTAI